MDIKYKVYTEAVLYLHSAEDYYNQLENDDKYIDTYPNENLFESVSILTCNVSDIIKVYDIGDCRQIILQDNEYCTKYIEVIESMDEIRKAINECSSLYDVSINHIKFYNDYIENF